MQLLGILEAGQLSGTCDGWNDKICRNVEARCWVVGSMAARLPAVLVVTIGVPPLSCHPLAAITMTGQADSPVNDRSFF